MGLTAWRIWLDTLYAVLRTRAGRHCTWLDTPARTGRERR